MKKIQNQNEQLVYFRRADRWQWKGDVLRPMTMERRCCQGFFPNYSKKKSVEDTDTLEPPLWEKQGKMFFFLFVHAVVRSGTRAFTLKIVSTLIKINSRDDRPSIST